ncbi:ImmA/IrrE family metallo-endopeptidase [Clostridium beijerinckii]|uniref:ImmA/IrrE family metallo-endopeptidase n=1 Tax=Clostridium beijerinckii TaxID=1520 RepID=UPI002227E05B|nr:ImmA/IrrE family metallo-endopeptidase [Clostridium beijerinckii]UYZ37233.1 ImmA/IrrE family metallo-endopeptidase [Clostridium beijerinckii]
MNGFIINEINKLKKKYGTNNPFDIAKGEEIIVIYESLGSIRGYYNKYARQKFIHINEDLDEIQRLVTCGHELGHAQLHPNANTPFFKSNTFYSVNKLERQANKFDAHLLIDIESIDNYLLENCSYEQLASILNLPVELVKIRFNVF